MNQYFENQPFNRTYETQDDIFNNYIDEFRKESDESLVDRHNKESRQAFFGVGRQLLYLMALHQVMFERFPESPVYASGDKRLSIKYPVLLIQGKIYPYNEIK
jgi:hypothetical protein